jgi:hypothetical protein
MNSHTPVPRELSTLANSRANLNLPLVIGSPCQPPASTAGSAVAGRVS